MKLNEKLIKEYKEMSEVEFFKSIRKRAYKIRTERGTKYKFITITEGNELSVLQFYDKELRMISGNRETYYFNR